MSESVRSAVMVARSRSDPGGTVGDRMGRRWMPRRERPPASCCAGPSPPANKGKMGVWTWRSGSFQPNSFKPLAKFLHSLSKWRCRGASVWAICQASLATRIAIGDGAVVKMNGREVFTMDWIRAPGAHKIPPDEANPFPNPWVVATNVEVLGRVSHKPVLWIPNKPTAWASSTSNNASSSLHTWWISANGAKSPSMEKTDSVTTSRGFPDVDRNCARRSSGSLCLNFLRFAPLCNIPSMSDA